jgi:hypothetical protein
MFDGKIDFMDFNKIKINYGGKLTCRKIFKKKYIIFLILSIIILITLIAIFTVKNKKILTIQADIQDYENQKTTLENNYNLVKMKNNDEEMDLNRYKNQNNIIRNDINDMMSKEEKAKKENQEIITQRDELEKKSTSLSIQLKSEYELKDVYDQKISSLQVLLDNLKIEYNKLKEQKEEGDKSPISSSKIIATFEAFLIEREMKGSFGDKCFDGVENNYSPKIFHEKCDKSPILILIKTDSNKRIGAFIKVSSDGLEIKKDLASFLFNIDKNKYFHIGSKEYTTIVCDPDNLPQLGLDLTIKAGKGLNRFPQQYGKETDPKKDFLEEEDFNIENLEIYKVSL